MVAPSATECVAPRQPHARPDTPMERTRVLVDPSAPSPVPYPSYDDIQRDRMERKQSRENLKRCAPWWNPFPIHRLMVKCPECPAHFPPYYFAEWNGQCMCADCQAGEFQLYLYRLADWEDPERPQRRRAGLFTEVVDELQARGQALNEVNLTEETLQLMNEIAHYNATGTLATPAEETTLDRQWRGNVGEN